VRDDVEVGVAQISAVPAEVRNFSVVHGGPLYQLFLRAHVGDETWGPASLRVVMITAVLWLPLLILSAAAGDAAGGRVAIPFLLDPEVNTRLLIATPLLVMAEVVVYQRLRLVARQFIDRDLVPRNAVGRLDRAVASAFRLRNSVMAEAVLLAIVYSVGTLFLWRHYVAIRSSIWYLEPGTDGLSAAGWWLVAVSLPGFQFLLCRWYFRLFIWARFLWQVSRINLNLRALHPDRVGGLGFLSSSCYAFAPLLAAHGALLAGVMANRIFYLGDKLPNFVLEIFVLVGFVICMVLGPLMVFTPQLAKAKRHEIRRYGAFSERYVKDFETKWLNDASAAADRSPLGSSDIQSLADLGNSYEFVRSMRSVTFNTDMLVRLVAVTVMPGAPLLLTMIPLEELLQRLLGVLL
jgi:hypothetical protein